MNALNALMQRRGVDILPVHLDVGQLGHNII